MSDELNAALSKIRPHTNAGLAHQKAPALLLHALETTLKEQNTDQTPTAYFASLLTALDGLIQKEGTDALDEGDNIPAALYLLATVAPHVPVVVLRSQLNTLISLLAPLFPALNPYAPALRSQITILGATIQALDSAHLNVQGVKQCFASVLQLAADPRPKVRRKAAEAIKAILEEPPAPLLRHPFAEHVAGWLQSALAAAASNPIRGGDKQSDGAEDAIHILAFAKPLCSFLPTDTLSPLSTILLTLPRLGNPYLSQSAYTILAMLIAEGDDDTDSPAPMILKSIVASPPSTSDSVLAPAWVVLLGKIMAAYSENLPAQCAMELPSAWQTCWTFLESTSLPVREGAAEALISLTTCVSSELIQSALSATDSSKSPLGKMIALLSKSLDSVAFASATPQILAVLSALILALRTQPGQAPGNDPTPAESLLLPVVVSVGKLRTTPKFLHKESADVVLDTAMRVMGPQVLLRALPLNIEPEDRQAGREPRAFLLSLLPHPHPSPLNHFVSYFVPLSERMFNYQQKSEAAGNAAEAKMWNVLVMQVWAGLAGYVWNSVGLREGLTPVFAKLLANLLHGQQSLHPPVLNALRLIAEVNLTVSNGAESSTVENARLTFNLSREEATKNVSYLRQQAGNWLATLFNVFGSVSKESKGMVGTAIAAWVAIAGEQEITKAYKRVDDLLKKNLAAHKMKPAPGKPGDGVAVLQATEDLLLLLLPHLSVADTKDLFSICLSSEMLGHWDGGVQKRCYRLLGRIVETRRIEVDSETVLKQLLGQSQHSAASAKRDRFIMFAELLGGLPSSSLHMIAVLIPEAVLGTKEPSEKSRAAAFSLLVAMGRKMGQGGVVQRDKLEGMEVDSNQEAQGSIEEYMIMVAAGLGGATPHMISASVTAISRLVFEFKDEMSRNMLSEIFDTISALVSSANREIVKSTLGFIKLAIHSLPHDLVHVALPKLVPALLAWSRDHKNHFKAKVQHIFERMMRRFGYEELISHAESDEGKKVLQSIKKRKDRAKRKRAAVAEAEADDSEDVGARANARTGDAFEDVLYGSESETDDSDDDGASRRPQPAKAKGNKGSYQLLDDPDDPMDLLDGAASKLTITGKQRLRQPGREAKHFKTGDDGRMIIDEAESDADGPTTDVAGTAYRELQTSADGFTRNARGQVKFNKDTKKRRRDNANDNSDVELAAEGPQNKKSKKKPQKLGSEFKAKNAGGDVKRGKLDPYAYLSLSDAAKKTGRKGRERVSITGRR